MGVRRSSSPDGRLISRTSISKKCSGDKVNLYVAALFFVSKRVASRSAGELLYREGKAFDVRVSMVNRRVAKVVATATTRRRTFHDHVLEDAARLLYKSLCRLTLSLFKINDLPRFSFKSLSSIGFCVTPFHMITTTLLLFPWAGIEF